MRADAVSERKKFIQKIEIFSVLMCEQMYSEKDRPMTKKRAPQYSSGQLTASQPQKENNSQQSYFLRNFQS